MTTETGETRSTRSRWACSAGRSRPSAMEMGHALKRMAY